MSFYAHIVVLVLSVIALVCSLMGIAMAYWVAAVPGNSPEDVRLNFVVWTTASVLSSGSTVFFAYRLVARSEK